MNYLQLCQELVSELGLSGGTGPTAVTGNTILELNNVTRWIRDSALYIDNLWLDWKYLWQLYSAPNVAPNSTTLPAPAVPVRLWDINFFKWRQTALAGALWQQFDYQTRANLDLMYDPDNATPEPPPAFTINPDNSVSLAAPTDIAYDFKSQFWRRPIVLAANGDVPLMPAEFHRIIVCRAAVMYGNKEDAPEIIAGLSAEYVDILDKLQSDQLEGYALRRSSTDRERPQREITYSEYLR